MHAPVGDLVFQRHALKNALRVVSEIGKSPSNQNRGMSSEGCLTPLKQTQKSVDMKTLPVFVAQAGDDVRKMNHNFVGCISKEEKKKENY